MSALDSRPSRGYPGFWQPRTMLSAKLFEKCEMCNTYSKTCMAWKLARCIQQHWRMLYRLGSELLSNAFRLTLGGWNSLFLAQQTNYSCKITSPFAGVKRQGKAEKFFQMNPIFDIQAWH